MAEAFLQYLLPYRCCILHCEDCGVWLLPRAAGAAPFFLGGGAVGSAEAATKVALHQGGLGLVWFCW